jgi:hypothetical protein
MSRYSRDDSARDDIGRVESRQDPEPPRQDRDRLDRVAPEHTGSVAHRLDLPRTPERRPVILGRNRFMLRNSESELLATVGAFRAIALHDLKEVAENAGTGERSALDADVRSLRGQGLLQTHGVVINSRSERVALLTRKGRELLERHRRAHVGLIKTRKLTHDAQLYRMFQTERKRLETEGATITRVVFDYELSADYNRSVHEQHMAGIDVLEARRAFAEARQLPFAGERIHFPDVRIEYESADGRTEYRDLEFATEHYSRSAVSAKVSAGFRVYRAAGAGARRGGTPSDPHHLESIG